MKWFIQAIKNYAVFQGRARRKEYWYFLLFYFLFYFVLAVVDVMTGSFDEKAGFGFLTAILTLALLIPSIAVSVRRLHDTDRSGWWLLIGFLPLIGAIVLLIFFVQDSQPGQNRYGQNPQNAFI